MIEKENMREGESRREGDNRRGREIRRKKEKVLEIKSEIFQQDNYIMLL